MTRVSFPDGFRWGAATASYQIEGGTHEGGKGESIWDRFTHTAGRIRGGETGERARDSYHRYPEDVALLRAMNMTSYRFSIAWPRIQPNGRGAPNAAGLDYYRRLVDALLAAGIRPFPTLYHWDLPQALEDRGGWPERDTAARFAEYAHLVVRALGDRVSSWMLFNEPGVFTTFGYGMGIHAPGRRDPGALLRATHVVNLAQGEAFRAVKEERPGLRVGTALSMSPTVPESDSASDAAAAERMHGWLNDWFLRPALRGEYPACFENGLPAALDVREGDMARVQVPLDFLGVNLYSRMQVRAARDRFGLGAHALGMGGAEGPHTDFGWEVWRTGRYAITMDDDLQQPPEEVAKLVHAIEEDEAIDVVIGRYERKAHPALRNLGAAALHRIERAIFGVPPGLFLGGFRVLRRGVVDEIRLARHAQPRIGPLILSITSRIKNVPVRHEPRRHGRTGYTLRKLVRDTLSSIMNYSSLPLQAVSVVGFGAALLSVMLAGVYLWLYFSSGIGVSGFTTVVLLILFTSGAVLFSFGLVGEYLRRIVAQQLMSSQYHVRAELPRDARKPGGQ
jgi:beta-glucosidase